MRSDEFLDLYRRMEELLNHRYEGKKMRYSSVVFQFMNDPEGGQFKDTLNTCREMRNILTHRMDIKGEPPLEPSQGAVDMLKEIVAYLSAPPKIIDFATPGEKIFSAGLGDNARDTMKKMIKFGFSHIPVLEQGKFFGIFSVSTVFSKALYEPDEGIGYETTIGDFADYLPIESHVTETFVFVDREAGMWEVRSKLGETKPNQAKRLAAVFITDSGSPSGKLLGMVTSWDVFGYKR